MRPKFIDHEIAMGILGGFASVGMSTGSPAAFFTGAMFSVCTIGPILWWLKLNGNTAGQLSKPANIFYTDDCTEEERERFIH